MSSVLHRARITGDVEFRKVAPEDIVIRDQLRSADHNDDGGLEELGDSIAQHGVIQEPLVTEEDGELLCLVGKRRVVAARTAGIKELVVRIVEAADPEQRLLIGLHENIHRSDLTATEVAGAIKQLIGAGWHVEDVASFFAKSPQWISKHLTIEEDLETDAAEILFGTPQGEAKEVLYEIASSPADKQIDLARTAVAEDLSSAEVRQVARQAKAGKSKTHGGRKPAMPVTGSWKVPGKAEVSITLTESCRKRNKVLTKKDFGTELAVEIVREFVFEVLGKEKTDVAI